MLSWFHQLDRASSIPEVVRVCRDYLATWPPEELALLPQGCRPGRFKSDADLEALHSCLVDEYRRDRLSGDPLSALQRMTSFVVRASVRVAQLQGDSPEAALEERPQGAKDRRTMRRDQ